MVRGGESKLRRATGERLQVIRHSVEATEARIGVSMEQMQ